MAGGRISKAKYRMVESQKPDSEVADSTKRLASRFYQLKTGDARIRQYLHWAKIRPDGQWWWCKHPLQTRDHLFKVCRHRRGTTVVLTHTLLHGIGRRGVGGRGALFFISFPLSSSLAAFIFSWDRPGRRAKGSLQRASTARTTDRKTGQNVRRHDVYRSNASMVKQKKNPLAPTWRRRKMARSGS